MLNAASEISKCCLAIVDWASGVGARETALLFAEAGALAWPENARMAWVSGRMFRTHGRHRLAEYWLRRASRVAVWRDDLETQDLALNSLGNLCSQQGSFVDALSFLSRALRVARKHKIKGREGAVTHDLFAVAVVTGDHAKAERPVIPFAPGFTNAARTLLDQGVTELADAELEGTPDAIRPRLEAVHAQPLKRLVEPALSRFVSTNARTLVRAAAQVTTDGGKADDLAAIFGATERTVSGWCVREALSPPRRLLAWMRLILALALLEAPRRSVANAAMGAGYSFDYALRRAVRDMLGGTPRQRSVSDALTGFGTELRLLRERRREQGREPVREHDD